MSAPRGRPRKHNYDEIEKILYKFKDLVKVDNQKIQSKSSAIWMTVSAELKKNGVLMPASSLYSFVSCNINNIRDKIIGQREVVNRVDDELEKKNDISLNLDLSEDEDSTSTFEVHFSKKEFEEMLVRKKYNNNRGAEYVCKVEEREYAVLESGNWQARITEKIWIKTKKSHGFHFSTHKIYLSTNRCTIDGKCKCGSIVSGEFSGKLVFKPFRNFISFNYFFLKILTSNFDLATKNI